MTQWGSGWPADNGAFGGTFEPFGTPPEASPSPRLPGSRWPLAALFAGLCALAVAFFPAGIGFVAIPVGIFGIVAGVLGVQAAQREGRGAGSAISGIVASVLAMAVAAVMFFVFYRAPSPAPSTSLSSAPTTTSKALGPGKAIAKNNHDTQSVLKDEVDVSFGPYINDGGTSDAQNPVVEMTVVSKRDVTRFCVFTVRAVDSAGVEVYPGLGVQVTLTPGATARQNVFGSLGSASIPQSKADRLKGGTFEVTKASCS